MKRPSAVTAVLLVLSLAACRSTQTHYLHKNADLGAIQKVAILPFETLAADRTSSDKVQKIFYIELLALDVFQVAEPGQVTKVTRGADVTALGPADFQRIGKELGVDGLFLGSVVDFAESSSGTSRSPDVTIQLRLVETQTGSTVWSTSQTRSGATASTRLFGVGGESLTEAARRMVKSELGSLLK